MEIMLGNLTTEEMVVRLGIDLDEKEVKSLESKRIDNAQDIPYGRWHCFDMPFKIVTGDDVTATEIVKILTPHNSKMKTTIAVSSYGKQKEEK